MIAFDDAVRLLIEVAKPLGREQVPIAEADGRVLCDALYARIASPRHNVSAMDGYAVRNSDLERLPSRLRIIGQAFPGNGFDGSVDSGACVRIFTGARVPDDADRVVIQEIVEREGDCAIVRERPAAARHIRTRGCDFAEGEVLLAPGRRLGYRELVTAAGGDHAELPVWRRPGLFVLSTGDELVAPGLARNGSEAVPESISFGVKALAVRWGAECVSHLRLPDNLPEMERAAADASAESDLVVVTGGASVGERDFAKRMFAPLGLELLFAKLAIKPGKPIWLGRARGSLILGLPGNPTSAIVTARLLLAPLVAGLSGLDPSDALDWRSFALAAPLPPCDDRETFIRARLSGGAAHPISNQDSSAQKALSDADVLLRRRPLADAAACGDMIEALAF